MSAHVLLNLLNKFGKRDKMRGLLSILSLFPNEFNKFSNTRAPLLDSIYHMTLKLTKNHIFGMKTYFFHYEPLRLNPWMSFPLCWRVFSQPYIYFQISCTFSFSIMNL